MSKDIETNEMADYIYWKGSRFDILTKSGCEDLAETLYDLGYRKQSDDTTRLNKEIERLKLVIQARDMTANELSQEIVSLKQDLEVAKDNELKAEVIFNAKQQAIKEFAEKLKSKFDEQKHFYEVAKIGYKDISLTALNTTYKMLDDLLKEYGEKV